jgi:hypothetical protein
MKNINLLIVASSDMDGTDDNYNLPADVINNEFPCSNYNGKKIKKNKMTTDKSPRCKKCHYTEVEHKYNYPLFPLHPVKLIAGENKDTDELVYGNSEYSDLWMNKYIIFERIQFMFGDNININYHTITPTYVNNLEYLPTIDKINNIISNKLKLKGAITYKKPYHFSCMLDEIYKQKNYKNTKYDCIFVVSGGFGCLYTPENFEIMTHLLRDKSKMAIIGHLWNISIFEYAEYFGKFKFMNPINSCLFVNSYVTYFNSASDELKKDLKKCITDYTKILLDDAKFIESYEMLFRV